jgi:hypothetical protein
MFISILCILMTMLDEKFSLVEITNKMQPCNRIYYSTVHWRLNMFRGVYRSSSGAPNIFAASGLHTHVVTGHSQVWVGTVWASSHSDLTTAGHHMLVNQKLQIQLERLMMSGIPLETCWAFNERWNNKFYYKVASCCLFLLSHTTIHGSMNIKVLFNFSVFIGNNIFVIALILLMLNSFIIIHTLDTRHWCIFIWTPFPLLERSLTLFWKVCVWLTNL